MVPTRYNHAEITEKNDDELNNTAENTKHREQ
jgi:hypothetical protein